MSKLEWVSQLNIGRTGKIMGGACNRQLPIVFFFFFSFHESWHPRNWFFSRNKVPRSLVNLNAERAIPILVMVVGQ